VLKSTTGTMVMAIAEAIWLTDNQNLDRNIEMRSQGEPDYGYEDAISISGEAFGQKTI